MRFILIFYIATQSSMILYHLCRLQSIYYQSVSAGSAKREN